MPWNEGKYDDEKGRGAGERQPDLVTSTSGKITLDVKGHDSRNMPSLHSPDCNCGRCLACRETGCADASSLDHKIAARRKQTAVGKVELDRKGNCKKKGLGLRCFFFAFKSQPRCSG